MPELDGMMAYGIPQEFVGMCMYCYGDMFLLHLPPSKMLVHIGVVNGRREVTALAECEAYKRFWQEHYWADWERKLGPIYGEARMISSATG